MQNKKAQHLNQHKPIRFAVIGCGHIGKRHAAIISELEGAELVALCDSREKHELGLEQYEQPYFSSINDLLDSGIAFDMACICTPNGLHENHALQLLDKGFHVLIEKPMALSSAGCKRIIALANERNRQVYCVMQNRYAVAAQWLKKMLDDKQLGDIYLVQINCFWNRDQRYYTGKDWHGSRELDGGTLFTQFSHFIDSIHWFFGDIKNINARFSNHAHRRSTEFEDTGLIHFDLLNGGSGSFNYTTSVYDRNLDNSMTIIAEKGTVVIGGQYMEELRYCNIREYAIPEPDKNKTDNHLYFYKEILSALNGTNALSGNADEGMKVVELIERMYAVGGS